MKLLLTVFLGLTGFASGVGASILLGGTAPDTAEMTDAVGADTADAVVKGQQANAEPFEYVKLPNQFVIPVIQEGSVEALVVMSISLEVSAGSSDSVYSREPKLRDGFLRALFDHANLGGFSGNFTDSDRIEMLRNSLLAEARNAMGAQVQSVLITDLARQAS